MTYPLSAFHYVIPDNIPRFLNSFLVKNLNVIAFPFYVSKITTTGNTFQKRRGKFESFRLENTRQRRYSQAKRMWIIYLTYDESSIYPLIK